MNTPSGQVWILGAVHTWRKAGRSAHGARGEIQYGILACSTIFDDRCRLGCAREGDPLPPARTIW